jgi:hypothetical protein
VQEDACGEPGLQRGLRGLVKQRMLSLQQEAALQSQGGVPLGGGNYPSSQRSSTSGVLHQDELEGAQAACQAACRALCRPPAARIMAPQQR